ncbi:MAG: 4Fe-4S dicluster domain-containing protein [Candidatus Bathyarchaeota archaeon]|nr:4Fe-4S dicluster domain-containing protein [Candidatus Bathyarchaeota archaeon]
MADNKNNNETKTVREIKMGDIDLEFKREISTIPGMEKLRLCFQCGSCTADCPIARFSDVYHPRRLLRMTQLGMKDRVLSSDAIWLCAACFTCVDHCPQGVDMAAVLRALRNLAVKEGVMPNVFRELTDNIAQTGYAYRIPELRLKRRAERGLPDLPKSDVAAVSKLLDVLGVQKQKEQK